MKPTKTTTKTQTELSWEQELAQEAASASTQVVTEAIMQEADGNYISTAGGKMSYNKQILPDTIDVVVAAYSRENAWYATRYVAGEVTTPACYSFAEDGKPMTPHEEAPDPQAKECSTCPKNQFGSSTTGGRGKACKNIRKLALVMFEEEADLDYKTAYLRVPVTSGENWAKYLMSLVNELKRPAYSVVTRITITPHAKKQFELTFKYVKSIESREVGEKLKELWVKEKLELTRPYALEEPREAPKKGKAVSESNEVHY